MGEVEHLSSRYAYSRFTKKRNNLKYATLGQETVSIIHYTRPGSLDHVSSGPPRKEATLRHANWPVFISKVAPKSLSPSI